MTSPKRAKLPVSDQLDHRDKLNEHWSPAQNGPRAKTGGIAQNLGRSPTVKVPMPLFAKDGPLRPVNEAHPAPLFAPRTSCTRKLGRPTVDAPIFCWRKRTDRITRTVGHEFFSQAGLCGASGAAFQLSQQSDMLGLQVCPCTRQAARCPRADQWATSISPRRPRPPPERRGATPEARPARAHGRKRGGRDALRSRISLRIVCHEMLLQRPIGVCVSHEIRTSGARGTQDLRTRGPVVSEGGHSWH